MELPLLRQSTEERRDLILHGSLQRALILLSTPTLLLGIVQALMPLVDGLFINNIAGTIVASSITYSGPILNMAASLAQGLSVAAMAIIGQLNGSGDFVGAKHTSTQIIVVSSILGLISAPFLVIAAALVSGFINPQIAHNVFLYLSLNAIVLPFSFMESIYNGIKNANGKPEAPFIRMVIMLGLKIVFNIVFIYALRLGIVGAALSSLAANLLITIWMFWDLFVKKDSDRLELRGFKFDLSSSKQLFEIGAPAMINSFILNLGFFLINTEVEKYGPVVLNGQGIANSITQVAFILPGAFSAAVTTMVSMNIGAGNPRKAKTSMIWGTGLSAIVAAALIAVLVPVSSSLTVLFTRRTDVLEIANNALHIYTYSVIGFAITTTIQGAFIGLGKTKVPLVLGILRIWFFRYMFILVTEKYLQFYSVFWGNLFSNYTAALIAIVLISRTKWESVIKRRPHEPLQEPHTAV